MAVNNDNIASPPAEVSPTSSTASSTTKETDYKAGTNWVHEGGIEANNYLFALLVLSPFISLLLAYVTSPEMMSSSPSSSWRITHPVTEMIPACLADIPTCILSTLRAGSSVLPTLDGARFIVSFMGVALILERTLPGTVEYGPETATGHVPTYINNAVAHCFVFSLLFLLGSDLGPCGGALSLWEWDGLLGMPLTPATKGICKLRIGTMESGSFKTGSFYSWDSDFYPTLRARVLQRLEERGLSRRGSIEISIKAIFLLCGFWFSLA